MERKSRYGVLRKLENKKSEIVAEEVTRALQGFQVFTITYDNGTEFAKHELVNASLGCQSFFCQPYASWEKGGVENYNGLVRDFYPKRTSFTHITQAALDTTSAAINERPKDVLENNSPIELIENIKVISPPMLRPGF